ncbi:hypothetical protein GN958_ATG22402 [Phytophthora infestans]|uniref:Uncharacterized protein n=1 Tax=Phytophthora infestans TaxID=4787 RepID=A0A8S9TP40_PHYIN|nr:hypothetical protein GN958_ATG22402 [Phytophthora infestans]
MLLTADKSVIVQYDSDFEDNRPLRSPTKLFAYYLELLSDEEHQEQDESYQGNDHDDEEDKKIPKKTSTKMPTTKMTWKTDKEAVNNLTFIDNEAAYNAGDKPSKTSKPSSISPDSQTP